MEGLASSQDMAFNSASNGRSYWTSVFSSEEGEEDDNCDYYRGIDFNDGTNRATYGLQLRILQQSGSPAERMRIEQGFKGFSLWSQLKPLELDPFTLQGMFGKVFIGANSKELGWSRVPGSVSRNPLYTREYFTSQSDYTDFRSRHIQT